MNRRACSVRAGSVSACLKPGAIAPARQKPLPPFRRIALSPICSLGAAVVERLHQAIVRVLKLPDVQEKMTAEGTLPVGGTPAQFGALLRSEVEKWRRIIQQASIAPASL